MANADLPIVLQKMEVIDLPEVAQLEQSSYPPDEAATRDILDYRITFASHLCYIALHPDTSQLIGFVVATGAPDDTVHLSAEMMRNHYQGSVLCIHSVVVTPEFRRKGYGSAMLKSYLSKVAQTTPMKHALLLSKRPLVSFYEALGFQQRGESAVSHGKDIWTELAYTF